MDEMKKQFLFTLITVGLLSIPACTTLSVEAATLLKKGSTKQDWQVNVGKLINSKFSPKGQEDIPGIEWQYTIKSGFNVLYMLFESGELKGMKQISFWLKSDKPGSLVVTLTESDNSNYQTFINLPAQSWKKLTLPLSVFSFDKDTVDENRRLDLEQISRFAIVDISGLTGKLKGSRTIFASELQIELDSPAQKPTLRDVKKAGDDSVAEIYTMKIDGTELTRLTFNSYYENHVHLSPDKTKFVFTAFTKDINRDGKIGEEDMDSSEVGIMRRNGRDYKLLTSNDFADFGAVWSPDGQRILFTTNRFGQFDLATIKIDGSDFQRLTFTSDAHEMDPHWIGDTIVFNRWTPGKKHYPGIWKMKSNGSGEVQLTNPSFPKVSKGSPFGDMDPKISPDGKKIVFERHQNNKGNFGLGDFDLYVMDIDGSNPKDISQNSVAEAVPVWSPDSQKLVYWAVDDKSKDALGMVVINANGSGRRKIAKGLNRLQVEMPSWLDNQTIVFSGKLPKN